MRCERIDELMAASLTSRLRVDDEHELREHLTACSRCAAERRELRETWDALDAWAVEEPPVLLTDAVKTHILRDLSAERGWLPGGMGRLLGGVALGIALAVVAIAFLPGRAALSQISPALLLSCAAFWAGVFVFASLLLLRPGDHGGSSWRSVGLAGLLAMGGSMILTRSCDVVTLVHACARSPWCGAVMGRVGLEGGYFVVGSLYAALPLVVALLLVRGTPPLRPIHQGLVAGALLFALLMPAILLQCVPFTAGMVVSWLGGTLVGSLVAGAAGSWAAMRLGWAASRR
ncbi:MAG: anti-sigma factor family protein [Candidatus Binatia bacterium]